MNAAIAYIILGDICLIFANARRNHDWIAWAFFWVGIIDGAFGLGILLWGATR